ncbi:hypothetical protein Aau02nite_62480 [Amorphoplanes auranticolor]|uniref:Alpha/beta hydrolase n=2 Tax=Actinoplanes auranticolor TaxID=47988 RepID=A0A919SPK4_9ACTN|nr:hypothetical protein Aau02nite_62480 [Actinoplanes auranticolor]
MPRSARSIAMRLYVISLLMPTITSADGTRLHVTSTGAGPGLVVVPGVVHEPGAGLDDPSLADMPGPGAMATFLTGLGFAPVGVVPLPAYTAFAWFLLQAPEGRDQRLPAGRRVAAPTLVITSDRGPEWLRPRLAELVPHARYVRMPQVDHHTAGPGAPAAVADLVRAFLTTDDAEAR